MTIEISTEDHYHLQQCVASGQFSSVEEALHHGVQSLTTNLPDDEAYRSYVMERIQAGIADMEAGRTLPAEQVLNRLRERLSR